MVDQVSSPTFIPEPGDIGEQRRAWEDEQVPYDDDAIASYEEDDLPPFDMPASSPEPAAVPVQENPAPTPETTAATASESGLMGVDMAPSEVKSVLDSVFGDGVVFKKD